MELADAFLVPCCFGILAPQVLDALVDLNPIFCVSPNLVRLLQPPGCVFLFCLEAAHFELENSLKGGKVGEGNESRAPGSMGFVSSVQDLGPSGTGCWMAFICYFVTACVVLLLYMCVS